MAGIVKTCIHVQQGASVAATFNLPANTPDRDRNAFAQPTTVQVCANCLAQGSGAGASTVKGGYSVGDSERYFGSKLQ